MTAEEAKAFLRELLTEQPEIKQSFKRNLYAEGFEKRYAEMQPEMVRLEEAVFAAEDKEAFLADIGKEPAASVKESTAAIKSKRKRELIQMQYSLTMVAFVLPYLLHYQKPFMDTLTDIMVQSWGEAFPKNKIKKATFEEINAGFKRKWCYITTAVCESLGKPEDCYELTLLRGYRDGYLTAREGGSELIRTYYDVAPTIVHRIEKTKNAAGIYRHIYEDYLRPCVHFIEENRLEECESTYRQMVSELEEKYLYS